MEDFKGQWITILGQESGLMKESNGIWRTPDFSFICMLSDLGSYWFFQINANHLTFGHLLLEKRQATF